VAGVFSFWQRLVVAADGLDVWNLDGQGGGDPQNPVHATFLELFGEDGVSTAACWRHYDPATYVTYDEIGLVASSPGRLAVVQAGDPPSVLVDNVALPALDGRAVSVGYLEDVGQSRRLFVLTDAPPNGRLYAYDLADLAAPALLAEAGLPEGVPASAIEATRIEVGAVSVDVLLVVRRGWGLETHLADLSLASTQRLVGEPQDVVWTGSTALVAAGDFGVIAVAGLPHSPQPNFVRSNGSAPGQAIAFAGDWVITPDGLSYAALLPDAVGFSAAAEMQRSPGGSQSNDRFPTRARRKFPWPRAKVHK
jgi:hypothetical protein